MGTPMRTQPNCSKMSYYLHFVLTFWCVLAVSQIEGQDSELDAILPSCRAILNKLIKEHVKIYGECVKELKATIADNSEFTAKINCAVKCTFNNSALLDSENKVTRNTLQSFMDTRVPPLYHEMGHDLAEHCLAEFTVPDVNMDDEYCAVYGKVADCLQHIVTEVCLSWK